MQRFLIGFIAGAAIAAALPSIARDPCDTGTWTAPQIMAPRVGVPEPRPIGCVEVDGVLRCQ